jgi:uncharacterized protein (DUF362 family)
MPRVAVVKGEDRFSNVLNAIQLIQEDVEVEGRRVLIKPNLVNVETPLCATHVSAVHAVLAFLKRRHPDEVAVGEGSALQDTHLGFRNYGYLGLEEAYPGLRFLDLNRDDYTLIQLLNIEGAEVDAKLSTTALENWYRISLTLPKTHETAIITLSMKNMMGCLIGWDKALMHGRPRERENVRMVDSVGPGKRREMYKVFHRNLLRLIQVVPPSLSVIDGFHGMEGEGPVHGSQVDLKVAVASTDFVAADAVMARIMGFNPMDIGYIYYADKEGLGVGDLSQITIVGKAIDDVAVQFTPHRETADELKWKDSSWYP